MIEERSTSILAITNVSDLYSPLGKVDGGYRRMFQRSHRLERWKIQDIASTILRLVSCILFNPDHTRKFFGPF